MSRTAITTLCIGDSYQFAWERYCRPSWERYANRHGYELVPFNSALDPSRRAAARSPAWQKCLVLDALPQYDRVLWLDADVVINSEAPGIFELVPQGRIGAVISFSYIHPDFREVFLKRMRPHRSGSDGRPISWEEDQAGFYRAAGVSCRTNDIVQTGVLVLEQAHRGLLKEVYDVPREADLGCYEQFPLSAAILNAEILHQLPSRFNFVFVEEVAVHYPYLLQEPFRRNPDLMRLTVQTSLANSYFLHFANALQWLPFCA